MKRVIWLEGLFIFTALGFFTTNGVADELYYTEFADEDGAFIQEVTGNSPIPAVYSSDLGTWSMEGDDSGPATNYLTSPEIELEGAWGVRVIFDHRYHFLEFI